MAGDSVPEVGDKASWTWNGSHPSGEVAEKKTDDGSDLAIKSARGNTIKAPASPSDPAVHLARPGNDVVKKQSELEVEAKGDGEASERALEKAAQSKADEDPELHLNGAGDEEGGPKTGEKRKAVADDDGGEGDGGEQPEAKKARGRPKGNAAGTPKKKAGRKAAAEPKGKKPVKEKKVAEAGEAGEAGEKKGRGRPKKDGSKGAAAGPKKDLKAKAQPVKGSMGTRTRSRA
ncbi:MAG: hypothetical protein Q9195_004871 [Heterodermia aff. obscurata]